MFLYKNKKNITTFQMKKMPYLEFCFDPYCACNRLYNVHSVVVKAFVWFCRFFGSLL